ncbi:MAG TPA: outer membrane protein assembly factor, partial [Novosphingobium sp.]
MAVPAGDPADDLKTLIPDSAVTDPEGWAKTAPGAGDATAPVPAAATAPAAGLAKAPGAVDPVAPLAELPGATLPWPDTEPAPPALASLPPDPDVTADLAAGSGPPAVALAKGDEERISDHLVMVFPARRDAFPERGAFIGRFKQLSALQKYGSNDASIAQVAARARADKELIGRLLQVYGYYDSLVLQTVGKPGLADKPGQPDAAVRFDVEPGPRYRFGAIDLGLLDQTG